MTTNRETTPPTPNAGGFYMPVVDLSPDALVRIESGEVVTYAEAIRRLATPMTAAQEHPAKGLEVEGYAYRWLYEGRELSEWYVREALPTEDDPELCVIRDVRPLTDHATAERQIAELRSRVAELEQSLFMCRAASRRWEDRALKAEGVITQAIRKDKDCRSGILDSYVEVMSVLRESTGEDE